MKMMESNKMKITSIIRILFMITITWSVVASGHDVSNNTDTSNNNNNENSSVTQPETEILPSHSSPEPITTVADGESVVVAIEPVMPVTDSPSLPPDGREVTVPPSGQREVEGDPIGNPNPTPTPEVKEAPPATSAVDPVTVGQTPQPEISISTEQRIDGITGTTVAPSPTETFKPVTNGQATEPETQGVTERDGNTPVNVTELSIESANPVTDGQPVQPGETTATEAVNTLNSGGTSDVTTESPPGSDIPQLTESAASDDIITTTEIPSTPSEVTEQCYRVPDRKNPLLTGHGLAEAIQSILTVSTGLMSCMRSRSLGKNPQSSSAATAGSKESSGTTPMPSGSSGTASEEKPADEDDDNSIRSIPATEKEQPLKIKVDLYIEDISQIREIDMSYRMDYYMKQSWRANQESCSIYLSDLAEKKLALKVGDVKQLTDQYFSIFWIPDTFVTNAKSSFMQSSVLNTQSLEVQYLASNTCLITYAVRYAGVMSCSMEFKDYPVDDQKCRITLRSFAYTDKQVKLMWSDATINPNLTLLEHEPDFQEVAGTTKIFGRDYSSLTVKMSLKRRIANKLAGVFTPSLLIVLITFTTYWLGPGSISDRVTIGITAFLAIIQSFASARSLLPPISYVSEIDVWMLLCMLFVAFQLLQATIVHYLYESGKMKADQKERGQKVAQTFSTSNNMSKKMIINNNNNIKEKKSSQQNQVWRVKDENCLGQNETRRIDVGDKGRKSGSDDDDGRMTSSTTTTKTSIEEEDGEEHGHRRWEEDQANDDYGNGGWRRKRKVRKYIFEGGRGSRKKYGWNHEAEKEEEQEDGEESGSNFHDKQRKKRNGLEEAQKQQQPKRGTRKGGGGNGNSPRRELEGGKGDTIPGVKNKEDRKGIEIGESLIEEEDITAKDLCDPFLDLFRVTECPPSAPEYIPMKVDAFTRILVPLFFFLFCAYYWPTLLARQKDIDHHGSPSSSGSSGHH